MLKRGQNSVPIVAATATALIHSSSGAGKTTLRTPNAINASVNHDGLPDVPTNAATTRTLTNAILNRVFVNI
jgi:hypothetical protein